MRILIVSDLHYALKQFDWLLSRALFFDLVIVAGDLLEVSSIVDRRAQIVVVRKYLEEIARKSTIVVCSGNHDLDGVSKYEENAAVWMRDLPRLGVLSDGQTAVVGGVTLSACAWWDGPQSRAETGDFLGRAAADKPERWLWVYHAPPADSPTAWGGQRSFGDANLNEWISMFRPNWVVCGHVHQAPFVRNGAWVDRVEESWVFNTGQQPGPEPAHIAIDLERNWAYWVSIEGTEGLDLSDPAARPQPLSQWPEILRA